jgi:UDP-N-acetylmuramoyl-tripeptide--D-alanyl-D-alanine ligase
VTNKPSNSWSINDIIDATGGIVSVGGVTTVFSGFSTDSRGILPEQCFVCLKGDTHDGHRFIPSVIRQGVKGVIVDRTAADQMLVNTLAEAGITCIAVSDTLGALGDLAAFHRLRSDPSVIALTGSNGKTTTRAMMTDVVGRRFSVLSPFGNFNNLIGVPLTLLRIEPGHEWAILELGMNRPGEIRRLGQICSPDIGLITNIGPAHLAGLGSLEGILEAKGEIIETLPARGKMIFNADDPMVMRLAKRAQCQTLLFGMSTDAEIRGTDISDSTNTVSFRLHTPAGDTQINLLVPGSFNVSNALAAAAVAYCLEIPLEDIKTALQGFTPVRGRLNILQTRDGVHLIDDTYNANPASVKAAIATLGKLRGRQRGIAVLGDMLELGEASGELHTEIGRFAAQANLDKLYLTGRFSTDVEKGARDGGMASTDIFYGSKAEILDALNKYIESNDWVLIKGSRGMRMETLVQALKIKHGYMENPT